MYDSMFCEAREFLIPNFREQNIHVHYLNLGKYSLWTLIVLMKIIRRENIDIVHLTGYGSTTFGRIAAKICGKSAIVHERWVDPNISNAQIILEKVLSRWTTMSIAVSTYAREFLVTKKRIREEKVALIPNGIPLKLFRNVTEDAGRHKRGELGIANDVITIGIVGMLDKNKGHKYFIEAASYVKSRTNRRAVFDHWRRRATRSVGTPGETIKS